MGQEFGRRRSRRIDDALQGAVERNEIGRIDIGWEPRLVALQNLAFGIDGDVENGEDLPVEQRLLRLGQRVGADRHPDRLVGVQRLDEAAAQRAMIMVDDRNGRAAEELAEIGLRIENAVKQRRQHEEGKDAAVREHAMPLGAERAADAASRRNRRRRRFAS